MQLTPEQSRSVQLLAVTVLEQNQTNLIISQARRNFDTSAEEEYCGAVTISPRRGRKDGGDVLRPSRGVEVPELPGRYRYTLDVGHPIARFSPEILSDRQRVVAMKEQLRLAVELGADNVRHMNLGIPQFNWFQKTFHDAARPQRAFYYVTNAPPGNALPEVNMGIAPSLVSLGLRYKDAGLDDMYRAACILLRPVASTLPKEVREALPGITGGT